METVEKSNPDFSTVSTALGNPAKDAGFPHFPFSPDQRYLAIADKRGVIQVTEVPTRHTSGPFVNDGKVFLLAFIPSKNYLVAVITTSKSDSVVRLIDWAQRHEVWSLSQKGSVNAIAVSPDGRLVITGEEVGKVKFIDAHNGRELNSIPVEVGVNALGVSLDGKQIAVGGVDSSIRILDSKGSELLKLRPDKEHREKVNILEFSRDGRYLAIASAGMLRVIDAATGRVVSTRTDFGWIYSEKTFETDGQFVALGCRDGRVRVIRAKDGEEVSVLSHDEPAYALAFSRLHDHDSLLTFAGDALYADLLSSKDLINEACERLPFAFSRSNDQDSVSGVLNQYLPGQTYNDVCPNRHVP